MTETCLPIVQWLKDWFYGKDEIDTELDGKSDTGHTHTISDITDYPTGGLTLVKQGSNWSGVTYTLYVDEANRNATFVANLTSKNIASGLSNYEMANWIPSDYRPKSQKFSQGYRGNNNIIYVWYDGTVGVANLTSSTQTNVNLGCQIDWNY